MFFEIRVSIKYYKKLVFLHIKELSIYKPLEHGLVRWQEPIPVAALSKAWVWGRWLAGIEGLNPAGAGMSLVKCCVFEGRAFYVWLIPRPEKPRRLWLCVCVCVSLSVIKGNSE